MRDNAILSDGKETVVMGVGRIEGEQTKANRINAYLLSEVPFWF